jgi:hypothetical protein
VIRTEEHDEFRIELRDELLRYPQCHIDTPTCLGGRFDEAH